VRSRVPVAGRPALHDVPDVRIVPSAEVDRLEPSVEELPCLPYERQPAAVLVGARPLPHDHHQWIEHTFSGHRLHPSFVQRAPRTRAHALLEHREPAQAHRQIRVVGRALVAKRSRRAGRVRAPDAARRRRPAGRLVGLVLNVQADLFGHLVRGSLTVADIIFHGIQQPPVRAGTITHTNPPQGSPG
jgi:hypothetical protein